MINGRKMKTRISVLMLLLFSGVFSVQCQTHLNNTKMDGYRGIWFELNQKYEYGDKYSGALSTYTAKHMPLAVYSDIANKTFFVFGGTTGEEDRYLLCMIGYFDHKTTMVSKPTVVYDKGGVDDPLLKKDVSARVIDYHSKNKNVYVKNMDYDKKGNPICLYIRSNGHKPGPESAPYEWCITYWDGATWQTRIITESDHNYDMGSLYISDKDWKIAAPTAVGPQKWGVGGDVEIWASKDKGVTWRKEKAVTKNSTFNHAYIRRPLHFKAPFSFFWSDGDAHHFSKSQLYFGDFKGNVWQLPYEMKNEFERPLKIK
jgi:hypothetical protein